MKGDTDTANGLTACVAATDRLTGQAPAGPARLNFGHAWDYAPSPERVKVEIKPRYGHFISGAFVEPAGPASVRERFFRTISPATVWLRVPE